jgi:hypothetical protein
MKNVTRAFWAIVAVMVVVAVAARAQTVTMTGLRLESPTLVSVQVGVTLAAAVRFTGDQVMVTRIVDEEWDGPGVVTLQAVFNGRDPIDQSEPFYIEVRQGTCMALTALDLHGVVCERRCIRIDRRDYDLDQIPTVLDFWAFRRGWDAGDDFNLDGATDVRDFIDYLNGWRE